MSPEPEPHSVGDDMGEQTHRGHGLGPHVIGTRVVVRHLLPDGRATDVLGTCTAWEADRIVIDRDGSDPVEIAVSSIVTGKPVPPRASVRARVSSRDSELHGLAMFPGLETAPLGEWMLRTDPTPEDRLYKRANSCLAMGQPDRAFPEAESAVRAFYAERDRPALVQVERESMTEHSFRMAGWAPLEGGETDFLVASVATISRTLPATPYDISSTEVPDGLLAELSLDGAVVARGRAAFHDDWLGIHGLATAPTHRRRGLARAVLADLVDWGAVRGATTVWLHVETDNVVGRAFYDSLGFRAHHGCRYLVPS